MSKVQARLNLNGLVYSPNGQQIASGIERLWDTQAGALGPILSDHFDYVTGAAYYLQTFKSLRQDGTIVGCTNRSTWASPQWPYRACCWYGVFTLRSTDRLNQQ